LGTETVSALVTLHDYKTGDALRPATSQELLDANLATQNDGNGAISVDGRECYVVVSTGPRRAFDVHLAICERDGCGCGRASAERLAWAKAYNAALRAAEAEIGAGSDA
jgi:hypothetical protein